MVVPEQRILYGESDPLPVDDWVPSVFNREEGEATYRQFMNFVQPYVNPVRQFFYRYYGSDLNAEQVASLCLLWRIASTCEEPFFLAKWIQPFSPMNSLNLHHVLQIIPPPQPLPRYQLADGTMDLLKADPLQLSFKTPIETRTFQEDQSSGSYDPIR